jgi:hypothetical protein
VPGAAGGGVSAVRHGVLVTNTHDERRGDRRGHGLYSDALEALEDTDWVSLQHAYGSAQDTPPFLLQLLHDVPEEQAEALGMLEMSVLHQGSLYSATAPAESPCQTPRHRWYETRWRFQVPETLSGRRPPTTPPWANLPGKRSNFDVRGHPGPPATLTERERDTGVTLPDEVSRRRKYGAFIRF